MTRKRFAQWPDTQRIFIAEERMGIPKGRGAVSAGLSGGAEGGFQPAQNTASGKGYLQGMYPYPEKGIKETEKLV